MNLQSMAGWAAIPIALIVLVSAVPFVGTASATAPRSAAAMLVPGDFQWAYGANYNASASWTNSTGGYSASLTAFYGWQTLLTQKNGTSGSIQLEVQRTAAVDYWLSFCKPSCSNPTWTGSLTFQAWESEAGFANLTTAGTVTVNGTQVPALALENESNQVRGNVTETVSASYHGILKVHTAEYYFSVNASSELSISFSPALGLIPSSLSPGLSWNSTSAFAASGGWSARYAYLHQPMSGSPMQVSGPLSGTVSASGLIALQGRDAGPVSLNNGLSTTAISIVLDGPFHVDEGFLLLPSESDVLGSGGNAWSSYQNDSATAATASADFAPHQPHLGLLASSTSYAPLPTSQSSLVDGSSAPMVTAASVPLGAAPSGSGASSGNAVVQGQPESVANSQSLTPCLTAGTCVSPTGTPTSRHTSDVIGLLVVGLLVGTLVALAVVVTRRRTLPPAAHPNARLYPTVPLPGPAAPLGKTPATSPTGSEDDPLGHLW
jgi:hypothetical protein